MKLFKITIWKFTEVLHVGEYQFNTLGEAQQYALGLYNGFDLCGQEPTGIEQKDITLFVVETILGDYECRNFTDVDPDVSGVEVLKNGKVIGSMIGESLPDEDETECFTDILETWLVENE